MNTIEINNCFKKYKEFKGTYPRDRIPNIIPKYTGIIINTDDSSNPGEHWVAVYNGETPMYFDSFGLIPLHEEIIEFLDRLNPNRWCHNSITFQSMTSTTCGMYCVYFLKCHFNGGGFDVFRSIFNFKSLTNDKIAKKLYKMIKN